MVTIVDISRTASFDVDAQKGFTPLCPQELPIKEADTIAGPLNDQAQFAQYRIGSKDAHPDNPIWLANDTHPPLSPLSGKKHVDLYWPSHCVTGSKGFSLLDALPHPAEYDYFIWKGVEPDMHPYGACYHDLNESLSTGVIEFLESHNIDTVIVGGLATDYCVKNTVFQLLNAGLRVIVNKSACRGIDKHTVQKAITEMQQKGAIIIRTTSELKTQTGRYDA